MLGARDVQITANTICVLNAPPHTAEAGGAKPAGWFHPSPSARNLQASSPGSNQANPGLTQNFSNRPRWFLKLHSWGRVVHGRSSLLPFFRLAPSQILGSLVDDKQDKHLLLLGSRTCLLPGLLRGLEENTLSPTHSGWLSGERMRSQISRPARSAWALPASPFL